MLFRSTSRCKMSAAVCCWCPSLLCMRTAARGTAPVLCTRHRRHRRKPFMKHARRTVGNGCLWWNPAYSGQICRWNCATTDRLPFCWIPRKSSRANELRPFPPLSTRVHVEKWIKLWKTFFTREILAEVVPAGQGKYGA